MATLTKHYRMRRDFLHNGENVFGRFLIPVLLENRKNLRELISAPEYKMKLVEILQRRGMSDDDILYVLKNI